ncbi:hypothetical protein ACFL0V_03460 [Nanoarchaeota archaeon]
MGESISKDDDSGSGWKPPRGGRSLHRAREPGVIPAPAEPIMSGRGVTPEERAEWRARQFFRNLAHYRQSLQTRGQDSRGAADHYVPRLKKPKLGPRITYRGHVIDLGENVLYGDASRFIDINAAKLDPDLRDAYDKAKEATTELMGRRNYLRIVSDISYARQGTVEFDDGVEVSVDHLVVEEVSGAKAGTPQKFGLTMFWDYGTNRAIAQIVQDMGDWDTILQADVYERDHGKIEQMTLFSL